MSHTKRSHGGMRPGAGRPFKYGEKTRVLRGPERLLPCVQDFLAQTTEDPIRGVDTTTIAGLYRPVTDAPSLPLTLYATQVPAGFPSPAEDYVEGPLDLHKHLVRHPAATFYVRVAGDSMVEAGIYPEDILVVDRSLEPVHGKVVIAVVNAELTVKRLQIRAGQVSLQPENPRYRPIVVTEAMDLAIWGVVTGVVRQL